MERDKLVVAPLGLVLSFELCAWNVSLLKKLFCTRLNEIKYHLVNVSRIIAASFTNCLKLKVEKCKPAIRG